MYEYCSKLTVYIPCLGNVTSTIQCVLECDPFCTSPEICNAIDGRCSCGNNASCVGLATGSFCDRVSSTCKCSEKLDACTGGEECLNGKCGNIYSVQK